MPDLNTIEPKPEVVKEVPKSKTKMQDIEDSFKFFDEDWESEASFNNKITYEVNFSKESSDNMLRISNIIDIGYLSIAGYEKMPQGENNKATYKLTKQPLASGEVLKAFKTLLEPLSNESMIISKIKWDSFKILARSQWRAFKNACLRDEALKERNTPVVQRAFQTCCISIGEIICDNNGRNQDSLFDNLSNKGDDIDGLNSFRRRQP